MAIRTVTSSYGCSKKRWLCVSIAAPEDAVVGVTQPLGITLGLDKTSEKAPKGGEFDDCGWATTQRNSPA